jgi:acetolactate synthase-1/2/3 large subunit
LLGRKNANQQDERMQASLGISEVGDVGKLAKEQVPTVFPEAADVIVASLEQIGVEYVFGVPGGAIEPLYNALARSQRRGGIAPIVARHESGAAFMADGYARETGRLGVCCTTTGPGATNAITGVASAYQDEIPMLVITAQTPRESFGRGAVQESSCTGIDTVAMMRHCTHYNTLVSHSAQLQYKLSSAIAIAFQARGPVHLSIPLDILRMPFEANGPLRRIDSLIRAPGAADAGTMDTLWHKVRGSHRTVVIVGEGCREATDRVLEFAVRMGAVVITTPQGKGLVDPYHANYRGGCGLAGHPHAGSLLLHSEVDLVLVIGSVLDEQAGQGWLEDASLRGKLVHIDELARHFVRSQQADLHVYGSIESIFSDLLTRLPSGQRSAWDLRGDMQEPLLAPNVIAFERRVTERRRDADAVTGASERRRSDRRLRAGVSPFKRAFALIEEEKYYSTASPLKPQHLMYELSRRMPANTRFLADIGNSFLWALHYLNPAQTSASPRRGAGGGYFRTSMGFASMGWAIGAAVGTALGDLTQPVVCLVGDGSYLMSGQEITTALMSQLSVIYIVLNDQALGTVKHGQRLAGAERVGFELPRVDYAAMAAAMGIDSYAVYSPEDLRNIDLAGLARRRAPTLIDAHIDGWEVPPLSERMRMLVASR